MTSAPAVGPPVFSLFSIGFSGRGVLVMRDLLTEAIIGAAPEWVDRQRAAPVAAAQGSTLTLNVRFQASNVDEFPGTTPYTVEATGDLFAVEPSAVTLDIHPLDGFSAVVQFQLSSPVPNGIGIRTFSLDWTATDSSGNRFPIGSSTHTLYVTWQAADLGTDLLPPKIPYAMTVRMAVTACAGQTTLDGICGALITEIQNEQFSHTITSGDVRITLLQRTADSTGFAELLAMMLLAHGVLAETRAFTIDWSHLPADALQWVPTNAGAPTVLMSGAQLHAVSLVEAPSSVLLCDPDVGVGPVAFPVAMPNDTAWTLGGAAFQSLLTTYLQPAAQKATGRLAGVMPDVPLTLSSIHFNFGGSSAVPLRDPVTDDAIGATAEWVAGMERLVSGALGFAGSPPPPAAYVRGTAVELSVRFGRTLDPQHGGAQTMTATIGATGKPVGIREQKVTLSFDPSGRSQPVRFETDGIVSADVGAIELWLEWYAVDANGNHTTIDTSTHPLYFIWQAIAPNDDEGLPDWLYAPLVKWTSTFAAGATSAKDVCDRIMQQLPATGLKYGVAGWTPRQMLLGNGGMCGGWYQLFQWMLHSQGILIAKRAFQVDWRSLPDSSVAWNAIVVSNGGLNQSAPPVTPSTFHDVNVFPIPSPATVSTVVASRYRFWGTPGGWADGHCVNFAEFDGQLYLYDASFHLGPIALDMTMPPQNGTVLGGQALADFVAKYLSVAVSHMLGSFTVNGQPLDSEMPAGAAAGVNGVSVVTASLPVMVGSTETITFRWI